MEWHGSTLKQDNWTLHPQTLNYHKKNFFIFLPMHVHTPHKIFLNILTWPIFATDVIWNSFISTKWYWQTSHIFDLKSKSSTFPVKASMRLTWSVTLKTIRIYVEWHTPKWHTPKPDFLPNVRSTWWITIILRTYTDPITMPSRFFCSITLIRQIRN